MSALSSLQPLMKVFLQQEQQLHRMLHEDSQDEDDDSPMSQLGDWLDQNNATSDDYKTYSDSAVIIFLLALFALLFLSVAIVCLKLDRVCGRHSSSTTGSTNFASDGNTVATLEDLEEAKGVDDREQALDSAVVARVLEDTDRSEI